MLWLQLHCVYLFKLNKKLFFETKYLKADFFHLIWTVSSAQTQLTVVGPDFESVFLEIKFHWFFNASTWILLNKEFELYDSLTVNSIAMNDPKALVMLKVQHKIRVIKLIQIVKKTKL